MLNRSSIVLAMLTGIALIATSQLLLAANPLRRGGEFYFVGQLQDRQFYQLAETYCRQQIATPAVAADEPSRIEWSICLIEALTMQAINQVGRSSGDQVWDTITEVRDIQRASTDDILLQGRLELNYQLAQLWRATWQDSMASTAPDPGVLREAAIAGYRQVSRELEAMDRRLEKNRPSLRGSRSPNSVEWKQLRIQLQFKLAETYQHQAHVYPPGSADNVLLLTNASNLFSSIARLKPSSPITLESVLAEIQCLRRLGKLDEVEAKLRSFPVKEVGHSLQRKHVVETAEWLVARGQPESAAKLLARDLEQHRSAMSRDLQATAQLALIEAYISAARKLSDGESSSGSEGSRITRDSPPLSANQWQSLAVELLNKMEETQSAYWVRKAESLLINRPATDRMESDIEILGKRANNLYHREQFAEAIATFRQAQEQADVAGLNDRAFDFGFQAAAVLHETQQVEQASKAFQQLATQHVRNPRAAQAHWLAIINAATLVRSAPANLPAYQELLGTHLRLWPDDATANSAALWLGRLLRQRNDELSAIEALQQVPVTSPQYADAMTELRASYLRVLSENALPSIKRGRLVEQAITDFERPFSQPRRNSTTAAADPDTFIPAYSAITAAEFTLLFSQSDSSQVVDRLTTGSLARQCQVVDRDRVEALLGLATALAGRPGFDEVTRQHWGNVQWRNEDWTLPFLGRLTRKASAPNQQDAATIARLEFDLIERLLTANGLKDDPAIRQRKASALVRMGKRAAAIEEYKQLAAGDDADATVLEPLAKLWEAGGTTADFQAALESWRALARASQKTSETWFTAKLGIARTLIKLGENKRACESLRLLQALHPSLGGPKFESLFVKLLAECK